MIVYSNKNKKIAPKAFYSSKYEFTYSYIYKCTLEMKPWHNFTKEHFFLTHEIECMFQNQHIFQK